MDQNRNKNLGDILQAETYQSVEEINREIEMLTNEIYRVVDSPTLTLEAKRDQIDQLEQRGMRLLEARSGLLGRAYHQEAGPFIARISKLKNGLVVDEVGNITQPGNIQPIEDLSKPNDRKSFLPEKHHKFDRQRGLQNIFLRVDVAPFPAIAKGIGLIKTLKEYEPRTHRQTIINLQKRFNPKIKKEWKMMLTHSSRKQLGTTFDELHLIRT